MIYKKVELQQYKLDKKLESEIRSKLFYISEQIEDFTINLGSEYIDSITFNLLREIDIQKKVELFIKEDISKIKINKDKILWESSADANTYYEIYDELVQKGIIHEYGKGRVAISEPLIKLKNYFDKRIKDFCVNELNAKEYIYPTMIDVDTIKKCGYMNSSPHMMFFINHLHNDMESYLDFKEKYKKSGIIDKKNISDIQYCLPPTMCYHTYRQLEGKEISDSVYTAKGKSFRYENKYANSIERLWDFTIRETVFFGSYEFVNSTKKKIIAFAQKLVEDVKLVGRLKNANDPFFIDEQAAYKAVYQKALNSKIELRLNIGKEKDIAVASFNFHDNFFCRNFDIKKQGEGEFVSGCTGFGLERLVYAFLCQYGLEESEWPISIL